jgi:hypothetical protein
MTRTVERNGIQVARHAVFLAILVIVLCGGAEAQALKTWDCGPIDKRSAVKVTLANGTLRVSGGGEMDCGPYPWRKDSASITGLIIEDGVTHIGDGAFRRLEKIKSVKIPNSVIFIGKSAFDGCDGLTSITIPGSIKSIGEMAFSFCSNLKSVTIQSGVKSIERQAFYACTSLTSVTIPGSVTSIGESAFNMMGKGCPGLKSITIPDGVTSVGRGAFNNCTGLTSIKISKDVTSIGDFAFDACTSLTTISVNKDNPTYTSVDNVLFNKTQDILVLYPGGKQGAYTIPNNVTTIGKGAFANCAKLTSVSIPNGVTEIGEMAFVFCTGLTSVIIPNSVNKIGGAAFLDCTKLTSVTNLNHVPPVIESDNVFSYREQSTTATLYVPANAIRAYKRANGWGVFDKIRPVEN